MAERLETSQVFWEARKKSNVLQGACYLKRRYIYLTKEIFADCNSMFLDLTGKWFFDLLKWHLL